MSKQISCRFVRLFQSTPSSRRATFWKVTATTTPAHFNPRPPHGGRLGKVILSSRLYKFQSTPSSRRATNQDKLYNLINPISIHALLTEGDRTSIAFFSTFPLFQSTPSSRRATYYEARMRAAKYNISIHALLTEGDVDPVGRQAQLPPISIHALLTEGDRIHTGKTTCNIEFQSTPSSRRATLLIFN